MSVKVFAAIDVGSYELAMKIFQFSGKDGMREIDHIRHRVELGTDTYNTGKISHERVEELCDVLRDFAQIMQSYHADAYRAYGTSAIRETVNAPIILEQIKLRTGLNVSLLSNSEQRFLHYKAVASKGEQFSKCIGEGAAVVDIGGGSIQISLFDKDALVTTQNIRLGILRMREQLLDLKPKTNHYERLLEELADNQLNVFKRLYLKDKKLANIILVDDYISYILQTMSEGSQIITADQFNDFVDHMLKSGPENYAATMGIAQESASLLLPSAILVRRILKATKAEQIWAPGVSLADGIAYEYGEKEKIIKNRHDFENDIVACAVNMSKRYQGDAQRNKLLEDVAVSLFDQTKKIHGCGKRERLLLRIAALLNDCGRFVSLEASAECGYSIIMATEMIGLSHAEREIVANMVRFNKTNFDYSANMGKESYLKIAKLTAIFRVADGICRSYRTKVKDVKFAIREDELLITVDADDEITLEKGFFGRKASMFEEVFGIRPVLRQKKAAV